MIKSILLKTINQIGSIILMPLKLIIKKKNVVILQTYSLNRYCDNSRYLYEYLSKQKRLEAYWVTNNAEIKKYINSKGWLYISHHNPIKMVWVAMRAKVILDNGDGFFNIFNITNSNSVIKISCLHGNGPKTTLSRSSNIKTSVKQILDINKFDYVNFPSKNSSEVIGKRMYFLPNEKIITFGYPRCEKFHDLKYVDQAYAEKTITRLLAPNYHKKYKVIYYTPTWRPYKYNFPLEEMNNFSYTEFSNWLKSNNLIFFYSVHTNVLPDNLPQDLDNIIFIDHKKTPLFDTNEFMLEVDILLNDYATTSIDFSFLKRPQLFFMPDYEYYNSIKGFQEDYRKVLPGNEVHSFNDLKSELLQASSEPESYIKSFLGVYKKLQTKYYDIELKNSIKNFSNFIENLL